MIFVLILAILIIAFAAFCVGPAILDICVETYDDWVHVFHRIQRRRKK